MIAFMYFLLVVAAAADCSDGTCDSASLLQGRVGTVLAGQALDQDHQDGDDSHSHPTMVPGGDGSDGNGGGDDSHTCSDIPLKCQPQCLSKCQQGICTSMAHADKTECMACATCIAPFMTDDADGGNGNGAPSGDGHGGDGSDGNGDQPSGNHGGDGPGGLCGTYTCGETMSLECPPCGKSSPSGGGDDGTDGGDGPDGNGGDDDGTDGGDGHDGSGGDDDGTDGGDGPDGNGGDDDGTDGGDGPDRNDGGDGSDGNGGGDGADGNTQSFQVGEEVIVDGDHACITKDLGSNRWAVDYKDGHTSYEELDAADMKTATSKTKTC